MSEILTERNLAQWLGEGDPESEDASREIAKELIDPIHLREVLIKLELTTELMLSNMKQIMTNTEASDSGRISAMREIRKIMADCGMSNRDLNTKFNMSTFMSDILRKRVSAKKIESNGESKPAQLSVETLEAKALLNETIKIKV